MQNLRIVIIFIALFTPISSLADVITPSHVYQVTEDIKSELAQIYKALDKTPPEPFYNIPTRQPRHVLQKAREVLLKLHRMKQINNIESEELMELPVMDVTPKNVKQLVDHILQEITEIKPLYSISSTPSPAPFINGKTPTDAYGNLAKISASIDELMGKDTLPQNVYRTAVSVVGDIEQIRKKRRINKPLEAIARDRSKTPTDVYDKTYILLEKIQELSRKKLSRQMEYQIPGGVLLPRKIEGRKIPADVQELLNQIQAELGAMKFVLGIKGGTMIPPEDTNKTPPDVYKQIEKAIMLVDSLL